MTLNLRLKRDADRPADYSFGLLFVEGFQGVFCHTLEDEHRLQKIKGETRIPAGRYQIKLRTEGKIHPKYAARFPWHHGMLWLQNVPGFEYVYIHIGNDDDDTEGCILVGLRRGGPNQLLDSVAAYTKLYPIVAERLLGGESVWITIED